MLFKTDLLYPLALLITLSSCFKEYNTDSLLQKKYDVVISILAPDTAIHYVRNYPVEVFVGRIIPSDIHNIFVIEGMQDSVLMRLMEDTRKWYLIYYEYDVAAKVSIRDSIQNVQLAYVGNGIYRDVNNELNIRSMHTYTLTVEKNDGRTFTSNTTVPGEITIDSINGIPSSFDTLYVSPDSKGGKDYPYRISSISEPFYYIMVSKSSNFSITRFAYLFKDEIVNIAIFKYLDRPIPFVHIKDEIGAINKDFGTFAHPASNYSFSERYGRLLESLENKSISENSNIQGKDVVGVFGAYNATRKEYVVKAITGNNLTNKEK